MPFLTQCERLHVATRLQFPYNPRCNWKSGPLGIELDGKFTEGLLDSVRKQGPPTALDGKLSPGLLDSVRKQGPPTALDGKLSPGLLDSVRKQGPPTAHFLF